ncbi:MAG: hypothetical protein AAGA57_00410 [Planctomycetota bacterium]
MDDAPAVMNQDAVTRFAHPTYTLRRKVLKILGARFHVYDPDGNLALYVKLKALKVREDIRLYADEEMTRELLRISTKSWIDFSGGYQVFDSETDEPLGTLQRKGLKSSFLRDEWLVLDAQGVELAKVVEESMLKALVRRFVDDLAWLMPQKFEAFIGEDVVASYKQNFNPFVQKIMIDFSHDPDGRLDPRLGLAAAVLLCAIEGRQ